MGNVEYSMMASARIGKTFVSARAISRGWEHTIVRITAMVMGNFVAILRFIANLKNLVFGAVTNSNTTVRNNPGILEDVKDFIVHCRLAYAVQEQRIEHHLR